MFLDGQLLHKKTYLSLLDKIHSFTYNMDEKQGPLWVTFIKYLKSQTYTYLINFNCILRPLGLVFSSQTLTLPHASTFSVKPDNKSSQSPSPLALVLYLLCSAVRAFIQISLKVCIWIFKCGRCLNAASKLLRYLQIQD